MTKNVWVRVFSLNLSVTVAGHGSSSVADLRLKLCTVTELRTDPDPVHRTLTTAKNSTMAQKAFSPP